MSAWRALRSPRQIYRTLIFTPRLSCLRHYVSSDNDAPVKFSESPASGWKASLSRQGLSKPDDSAWFQPYVVLASVSIFLIYFCILREENDIDELLSLTLYDRIEGLEKVQLQVCLEYNINNNLPTEAIEKRLYQLEQEEIKRLSLKKETQAVGL